MTLFRTSLFCVALLGATPAVPQTDINLGTLNADPTMPVEITADSLSIDQESGTAVFQGNVVMGQGEMRLSAGRVQVFYSDVSGAISRLSATGGVTFVTETDAAEAASAEYNLDAGTLVLTGDVLLTQGASAISADTMNIDLESGAARMDGRVRTIFVQGDE